MADTDVKPTTQAAIPDKAARRVKAMRIVLAAVALVLIAALVLPVFSTLQPGYYARYPSLAKRMDAWRASTHSRFECSECHVDPGTGGFVSFAEKSIPAFYSQLFFGPKPSNLLGVPSTAACLQCHDERRTVSPSGDLMIPHEKHVTTLNIKCATCHKNLVHSLNVTGANKPEMATCLVAGCHDGKKATNECAKCHTQIQVPADHKAADWLTVHPTMVNKIDCGKCHAWTVNYCVNCHSQRPPSHVGNWKQDHSAAVKTRGEKGCLVCHDRKKFCNTCH